MDQYTRNQDRCKNCNKVIGILAPYTLIKEAVKPPFMKNRYKTIGFLCVSCEHLIGEYSKDKYKK